MSAVQLTRVFPNDLGMVPPDWVIDMESYRDAKIQLQTDGGEVHYVVEACLVDAPAPFVWPVLVAEGQLVQGGTMLIHIETHYPKVRITLQGDVPTVQMWVCLSDRMEN